MKIVLLIFFYLSNLSLQAQQSNLIEYDFIKNDGYNEVNKEYLIFNDSELYYANITNENNLNYEDEKLDREQMNFEPLYINLQKDSLYQSRIGILKSKSSDIKRFLLVEKKPVINWKVTKESKKILGYTTYKATTTFRGRNYIAWFAPELPYNYGPWKLGGLPGLILKVENDLFSYEAKRVVLNSSRIPFLSKIFEVSSRD